MNRLLALAVLLVLCCCGADSLPTEAPQEATDPLKTVSDTLWSYYDHTMKTASGWVDQAKSWKLDDKARNAYEETSKAVTTYAGILKDQVYHILFTQ
ncbi:apolipoprotein C-II [Lepisosteus oculatus]|uniref:apolipoprotein C-II n=1 Tax=Lepisosteus oculatus TaxID=7918 RepID=UPI00073FF28B|nr:PREDICTED: apolipoprotein C-II-like [Lepisosteus oculatus]XP_015191899.1 PREDICTED: apolipoprotein C-II-like [Lepisosteus oculatus]XP_015191900.1 PREDICTED: apolipoprotein C-II-like [Lepisosteus oculatus]XP_015191901.1 PREDICTED: apolipoprotein C-II-like [Lepisosteus oculatus]